VDHVFALGLLLQSNYVLDLQLIVTTSRHPVVSAHYVAMHLYLQQQQDVTQT
jgi:hypothetical protein